MKLTTKLLLGATVVAGFSISTFAACATDVDMGAKKLTNVADGTADGDAVNVGQVLTRTEVVPTEVNASRVTINDMRVSKIGNVCYVTGGVKFVGTPIHDTTIAEIPTGFRPILRHVLVQEHADSGNYIGMYYQTGGAVRVFDAGDLSSMANATLESHSVYICQ